MIKTSRKNIPSSSANQTKKRTRKTPAETPANASSVSSETEQKLRIRMYRVGFGDFFLMTIPSDSGPQHILIDCGVTNGRTGKGDERRVNGEQRIEQIGQADSVGFGNKAQHRPVAIEAPGPAN
jgi:hypothetical protein